MTRVRTDVDTHDLCSRYELGESELALSKHFGINRATVRRQILKAGISPRGPRDANIVSAMRLSPEFRSSRAQAAHNSVRGKTQTEEHRRKIALSIERSPKHISPAERRLADMLRLKGFDLTPQKAIGRYNVDIALNIDRIAVEVFGGNWHSAGRHARRFRKRTDFLLNSGWHVVLIWIDGNYPIEQGAVDQIVSLSDLIRCNKTIQPQEWVIRGDGQPSARGGSNLDYRADIGGDHCGQFVRDEYGRFGYKASRM